MSQIVYKNSKSKNCLQTNSDKIANWAFITKEHSNNQKFLSNTTLQKSRHSKSQKLDTLKSPNKENRKTIKSKVTIHNYFQVLPKSDLNMTSQTFENHLAFQLFAKRFSDLETAPGSPDKLEESISVAKLNDNSIHFSRLDESIHSDLDNIKKLIENGGNENTYPSSQQHRFNKNEIIDDLHSIRNKIVESTLSYDSQGKCFDLINKIRHAIVGETSPNIKTTFRNFQKIGTPKKRHNFR